jgi:hypothetical protein
MSTHAAASSSSSVVTKSHVIKKTKPVCQSAATTDQRNEWTDHASETRQDASQSLIHACVLLHMRWLDGLPAVVKVDSLHPESKGDNLILRVVDLKVVLERTKIDGTHLKIAEVRCAALLLRASATGASSVDTHVHRACAPLLRLIDQVLVGDRTGTILLTCRNGESRMPLPHAMRSDAMWCVIERARSAVGVSGLC